MPATSHLEFAEIREFGGLWTRGDDILAPANSATIMSGCHPQPGGGLRPFFKVSESIAVTGIDSLAIGRGFIPLPMVDEASAGSFAETVDFALITAEAALVDWHLYTMRRSMSESSWTADTAAAFENDDTLWVAMGRQPFFTVHGLGSIPAKLRRIFFTIPGITPGDGLYLLDMYTGAADATIVTDWVAGTTDGLKGPICTHQDRLVVSNVDALVYSEPGDDNVRPSIDQIRFIVPNGLGTVYSNDGTPSAGSIGPTVAWVAPIPPSDFLACTMDGRLFNIQGDFDDPTIRDLGQWGPSGVQQPAITPQGVVCVYPNDGVYLVTPDGGRQFLSQALEPEVFTHSTMSQGTGEKTGFGSLAHSNGYVFCPNTDTASGRSNGALVYDMQTQAWFTSTHADDDVFANPRYFAADFGTNTPGVWGLRAGALASGNALHKIVAGDPDAGSREQRNSTWEWQSQPIRNPEGRQIEVREVHLALNCGADANVTVTLTNEDGTTSARTITPPAGKSVQRLLFRHRGEFMQVKVKAWEDTANKEAPTLESIRIGTRAGHLL